jgi:hypothetical protein
MRPAFRRKRKSPFVPVKLVDPLVELDEALIEPNEPLIEVAERLVGLVEPLRSLLPRAHAAFLKMIDLLESQPL